MELTPIAADKIKDIIAQNENPENLMLRIDFEGYGWGGPKLRLTLDELKDAHDKIVQSQGVSLVYNSGLEEHVGDLTIDYDDSILQRGFIIKGSGISAC